MSIRDVHTRDAQRVVLELELPPELALARDELQVTVMVSATGGTHSLRVPLEMVTQRIHGNRRDDDGEAASGSNTSGSGASGRPGLHAVAIAVLRKGQSVDPIPVVFPPRPPKDELLAAIRNLERLLELSLDRG